MSISYSGIIGNKAKVTNPSVENWSSTGDKSILRDPPKSITLRRIDKVNADGSLNDMMYYSGDRFAENISVYARGVNPMVSVEYGNNTTLGGRGSATNSNTGSGSGAFGHGAPGKLPYRILTDGAFRPPILRMEQLMPLSKQPRLVTQCLTNPYFIDYSKRMQCHDSNTSYRQVHKDILHSMITPTKTVKFQQPVQEHFTVNYVIENPIHTSAGTNIGAKGNLQQENIEPTRQMNKQISKYSFAPNMSGSASQKYIHNDLDLERNLPVYNAQSARSENIQTPFMHNNDMDLERNLPVYNAQSARSENIQTPFMHNNDMDLERNLPVYNTQSAKSENIQKQFINNDINLERNLPVYNTQAAKSENIHKSFRPDQEKILTSNLPSYNTGTNKSSNMQNLSQINEYGDIILERNLPEYKASSNSSNNRNFVRPQVDNDYNFNSKTAPGHVNSTKTSSVREGMSNDNRIINLPQSLAVGGFQTKATIPTSDKGFQPTNDYSTQKNMLAEFARKSMQQRK